MYNLAPVPTKTNTPVVRIRDVGFWFSCVEAASIHSCYILKRFRDNRIPLLAPWLWRHPHGDETHACTTTVDGSNAIRIYFIGQTNPFIARAQVTTLAFGSLKQYHAWCVMTCRQTPRGSTRFNDQTAVDLQLACGALCLYQRGLVISFYGV